MPRSSIGETVTGSKSKATRPGKPVDTDALIEAVGAAIDIKLAHRDARISRLEQQGMKEEA